MQTASFVLLFHCFLVMSLSQCASFVAESTKWHSLSTKAMWQMALKSDMDTRGLLARWLVALRSLSFGFLISKVRLAMTTSWNRLAVSQTLVCIRITQRVGSTHCWAPLQSFHTVCDALECVFLTSFQVLLILSNGFQTWELWPEDWWSRHVRCLAPTGSTEEMQNDASFLPLKCFSKYCSEDGGVTLKGNLGSQRDVFTLLFLDCNSTLWSQALLSITRLVGTFSLKKGMWDMSGLPKGS